jgi:hypothetical protein
MRICSTSGRRTPDTWSTEAEKGADNNGPIRVTFLVIFLDELRRRVPAK